MPKVLWSNWATHMSPLTPYVVQLLDLTKPRETLKEDLKGHLFRSSRCLGYVILG